MSDAQFNTAQELADFLEMRVEDLSEADLMQCAEYLARPVMVLDVSKMPRDVMRLHNNLVEHSEKPTTPAADRLFSRNGRMVHISRNEIAPKDVQKDMDGKPVDEDFHVADELKVQAATPGWIANISESVIAIFKQGAKGPYPAALPPALVMRLDDVSAKWKFPRLTGTVETPTLRKDGSLLSKPGYDKRSGIYFDPHGVVFPPIEERPTKKHCLEALEILKKVLVDFPFDDAEDGIIGLSLSVALAGILTAVVRRSLKTAPLFAVDANEVESGKTLLAQVFAIIATGRRTAARPFPRDDYQQETALAAALEAGDAVVLFDNVDLPIVGKGIEMAITEEKFKMRRLGGNSAADQVEAPTNSLLLATGNKIKMAGDMAGNRAVKTKLVPDEALENREFQHDPLDEYVIKHRPMLVAAALTILRGYIVAGKPKPEGRRGTYRHGMWRDLVADSLVWLGEQDPCLSGARVVDADPVQADRQTVLAAILEAFGLDQFTTAEALEAEGVRDALSDVVVYKTRQVGKRDDLGLALRQELARALKRPATEYLKKMVGVRLGGYRLHQLEKPRDNEAIRFEVREASPESAGADFANDVVFGDDNDDLFR